MPPEDIGDREGPALDTRPDHEAEPDAPFLNQATGWLRELLRTGDGRDAEVLRVLDVGSGPGAATCLLARAFPAAEVVAVDRSAPALEEVRVRADRQLLRARVTTQRAVLPDQFASLGPADVIWTHGVVQQLADQQAALGALAASLRRGGLLAVVERGPAPRFLPRDIGLGRPGLQARLDAAMEDVFTDARRRLPGSVAVVEDWPALLARAGLVPTGTRTFLTDHPAPLGVAARERLHAYLTRVRERAGDRLDAEDRASLESLLDDDACAGILWRPDAYYWSATTVHTARACTRR